MYLVLCLVAARFPVGLVLLVGVEESAAALSVLLEEALSKKPHEVRVKVAKPARIIKAFFSFIARGSLFAYKQGLIILTDRKYARNKSWTHPIKTKTWNFVGF